MEKLYAFVFSRDVALGIYRKPQALMERYRRLGRRFPVTDNQNLLVFDGNHDPRTLKIKDNKSINTSTGLLTVHPERALKYSWVSETHKMQVEQIGRARQAQLDAAQQRKLKERELKERDKREERELREREKRQKRQKRKRCR
ncbi:hypothetical protein CGCFRS4_v015918 [Colletotrichum fructicola]|nr:hypothetical protein CGCFRS4_v015918 [Colletotrichum fructicola]